MKALPFVLGTLAVITTFPAWMPSKPASAEAVNLTGKLLTRNGAEISPENVTSLRVVTWDDSASAAKVFEVSRVNGLWIIPSHSNYPADGGTRVGTTSGNVRNIVRSRWITNNTNAYEEYGVVDPLNEDTKLKGRGRRVVLKDSTGAVVLDVIIGKAVPDSTSFVYVRDANEKDIYTAKVEIDISTRFVDWVETDLLKVKAEDVRAMTVADYSIDEQQGAINERSKTLFQRADASAAWVSPQTPEAKQTAKTTVDAILNQLTSVRLTGVRKFSLQWLGAAGFFPSDNPALLSRPDALKVNIGNKQYALFGNEGRLDFSTKQGLRYSLLFGEISGEDEEKPTNEAEQAKKAQVKEGSTGHNRYMSVYVQYDPSLDEEAKEAQKKLAEEAEKKKAEAEKAKAEGKPVPEETKPEPYKSPSIAKASKEQSRFMQFFYVISDENFKTLRPALDKLFEAKAADPAPAPATGVTGAIGQELGLPPGTQPTPESPAAPATPATPATPAPATQP
jgi:Domain of unknown function (DUF4340)